MTTKSVDCTWQSTLGVDRSKSRPVCLKNELSGMQVVIKQQRALYYSRGASDDVHVTSNQETFKYYGFAHAVALVLWDLIVMIGSRQGRCFSSQLESASTSR